MNPWTRLGQAKALGATFRVSLATTTQFRTTKWFDAIPRLAKTAPLALVGEAYAAVTSQVVPAE